jgi:hypothetical protein
MRTARPTGITGEFWLLGDKLADVDTLRRCPELLGLLPPVLLSPSATVTERARVCRRVLQAVVEHADKARRRDARDGLAGQVLAAGALCGLVTERPANPPTSPRDMTTRPSGRKEGRQALAGEWLVDRQSTARGFRQRQAACLEAFQDAAQEWLRDESAVLALARQLGRPLTVTAVRATSEAPPTSDVQTPSVERPIHDAGVATARPGESGAPMPIGRRRRYFRLAIAVAIGFGLLAITAWLVGWLHSSSSEPVVLQGQVTCRSGASVAGVWIQTETGTNSGWASTRPTGSDAAGYEYVVPANAKYSVHVGCGGTRAKWANEDRSAFFTPSGRSFVCDDHPVPGAARPYGTCVSI